MKSRDSGRRATTLVELMVAFGILSLVMTAVLSFYVEAVAVTAKRDKASDRLRRFHLGLDKIEQTLREGRLVQLTPFRLTLLHLSDLSEQDGFPAYSPAPVQFVSKADGVHQIMGTEDRVILPFQPGERMIFQWLQENPPLTTLNTLISVELYYSGAADGRSDLLFRRTLNLDHYFGEYSNQED
jgi:type II secretory pathway pseudopilin PulG